MLDDLADLLLGACCPGCGQPGLGVCATCRGRLPRAAAPVADAAALPAGFGCHAAGVHAGELRELLTAHKDRGSWMLAPTLGELLATAVLPLLDGGPIVLVPLPSSRAAVRRRGYDHSAALARAAGARLPGRPRVVAALRRSHRVADQASLGRDDRARNQRGSMAARPPGRVGRAVVVDDICTTGASLAEARRALSAAGWQVLGGAVVAQRTHSLPNSSKTANTAVASGNVAAWHER